jgi:hypothetical protein
MLFSKLSKLVASNNLTQAEFEVINYKLTPQQQRLFLYLSEKKSATTIQISRDCSIGNTSETVIRLNRKLEIYNDGRQIVCLIKPHVNQFNQTGVIGHYSFVPLAANDSSRLCV